MVNFNAENQNHQYHALLSMRQIFLIEELLGLSDRTAHLIFLLFRDVVGLHYLVKRTFSDCGSSIFNELLKEADWSAI